MFRNTLAFCKPTCLAISARRITTSAWVSSAAAEPAVAGSFTTDNNSIQGNVTTGFTKEQKYAVASLANKLANVPVVMDMEANGALVREGFHWPAGKRRLLQAPMTLAYGALSGANDLPILPLVYRWKPGNTPAHLNKDSYNSSFQTSEQHRSIACMRVPGVSMVQYLGPNLGFNSIANDVAGGNTAAHTGVPAVLLDDITARVSLSNTPDKPSFTANFKLEYLGSVPTDCYVVLDAWVTKIEGRKTFITSYLADAESNKVFVKAQSLFICAA